MKDFVNGKTILSFLSPPLFFVITSEGFCWNNSLFFIFSLTLISGVIFSYVIFTPFFPLLLLLHLFCVEKYLIHDQKHSINEDETSKQMADLTKEEKHWKHYSDEQGLNLTLFAKILVINFSELKIEHYSHPNFLRYSPIIE